MTIVAKERQRGNGTGGKSSVRDVEMAILDQSGEGQSAVEGGAELERGYERELHSLQKKAARLGYTLSPT